MRRSTSATSVFLGGQKLRVWDDLLWGGHDKCPREVPSQIRTTLAGREAVRGTDGEWEVRGGPGRGDRQDDDGVSRRLSLSASDRCRAPSGCRVIAEELDSRKLRRAHLTLFAEDIA
jgi:hypothetical protein